MGNVSVEAGGLGHRQILTVLFGLIAGMFVSVLDQTVSGAALPTIVGELHGVGDQQWVTTVYVLASAISLVICGKLGDRLGHKSLFIGSIVLFLVGSAVSGAATDIAMLIAGRAIQGFGGGGLMVLAMSIMSHLAPPDRMRKYTPIFGITFGVSFVVGPLIGGFFSGAHNVHLFGLVTNWRWVFWLNLPVGLVALLLVGAFVPRFNMQKTRAKYDTVGTVLMSIVSVALILVTSWGGSKYAWTSPVIILLIGCVVFVGMVFLFVENAAADPIMPLTLFKNRNFTLVTIAGFVLGVVMMGTMAYLPTYLQMATGKSATMSGVYMLPMVAGMIVIGNTVNIIVTRTNRYKWAPLAGMAVMGVGLVLLSTMTSTTSIWTIMGYLGVMGVGMGMTMQTLMAIVRNEVPLRQAGTGNSTNMYFRTIGTSIGASFLGSMFTSNLVPKLAKIMPPGTSVGHGSSGSLTPSIVSSLPNGVRQAVLEAYSSALTPVFLMVVPLVVVAFVLLLLVKETPFRTTLDHESAMAMA